MPHVVAGIPKPQLVEVARGITKGKPPPDWLLWGLEYFNGFIGKEIDPQHRKVGSRVFQQMDKAASVLLRWLPVYKYSAFGIKCPNEVDVILNALPHLRRDLERLNRPRPAHRSSNVQREICAAVIAEAWKILHGKIEPRSDQLQQACADYWLACGGKQIGETNDRENWRRPIERALGTDHKWVREIMQAVQNSQ